MKKKVFLFMLLSLFCLSIFNLNINFDTAFGANEPTVCVIEVTNTSDSKISFSNDDLNISLSESSWSSAISSLSSILTNYDNITLNFNDFNITNESGISFDGAFFYTLSGKIISTLSSPIINLESGSNIYLENLEINSTNSTYIIYDNNSNSEITFGENFDYTNSSTTSLPYLINYSRGSTIALSSGATTPTKIFLPYYDLENEVIVTCEKSLSSLAEFYIPETSSYTIETSYSSSSGGVIVGTEINYTFNLNGGTYSNINASTYEIVDENYIITYPFTLLANTSKEFENQADISKAYATFDGWFGMVEQGGTTYYFDTNMLQQFLESGNGLSKISTYFTTDPNILDSTYKILGFSNSQKTSYAYYLHLDFFLSNNLTPTYYAKWTYETFTISFETDASQTLETIELEYGETIPEFGEVTKVGYTFEGWYLNSTYSSIFSYQTMPAINLTLYAKWSINSYSLNFETNGGTEISPLKFFYNEEIELPADPTKTGYDFLGWYEDITLENEFQTQTMPNSNVTIYAKWQIQTYTIFVFNNIQSGYSISDIEYGSSFPTINGYDILGYTFENFYTDTSYQTEFDFTQSVTSNIYVYAKYNINSYTITFVTNNETTTDPLEYNYNETVTLPTLTLAEYIFNGWYSDIELQTPATLTTMPAYDLTLYASWTEKETLNLTLTEQTYTYGDSYIYYRNETGASSIKIYYLVDEEWTTDVPTEIGEYDIRLTREEDEAYKSVDIILQSGFKIIQKTTSVAWLIIFFYFATLCEIAVSILIRMMRKRKLSSTYAVIGTMVIANSQFAHLIISGLICLCGFVYMTYQLVLLTRTVNNENFAPSKEDNRERFKDQLKFQNDKKNADLDFTTEPKNDTSYGNKYSERDVEKMLYNDTFNKELLEKREKSITRFDYENLDDAQDDKTEKTANSRKNNENNAKKSNSNEQNENTSTESNVYSEIYNEETLSENNKNASNLDDKTYTQNFESQTILNDDFDDNINLNDVFNNNYDNDFNNNLDSILNDNNDFDDDNFKDFKVSDADENIMPEMHNEILREKEKNKNDNDDL